MLQRCQVPQNAVLLCLWVFLAACATPSTADPTPIPDSLPPTVTPTPEPSAEPIEPPPVAALPALTWEREGGIAGFCDKLVIYPTGLVQAFTCRAENEAEPIWEAELSNEAITQVGRWQEQWASIDHAWTDDATADSMTERIQFVGQGTQTPGELDLQFLRDFAVKEFLTQQP